MIKHLIVVIIAAIFISSGFAGCRKAAEPPAQEIKKSAEKTGQEVQKKVNQIEDLTKNTKLTIRDNTVILPKDVVMTQNNTTYIDATPYATLATVEEKDNAKNQNKSSAESTQYKPVPIGTINIANNKYTLASDEKSENVLYLQEIKNNKTVSYPISINKDEKIIEQNGRTYIPLKTLQKIVNLKTKNDKRPSVKIEVAK